MLELEFSFNMQNLKLYAYIYSALHKYLHP